MKWHCWPNRVFLICVGIPSLPTSIIFLHDFKKCKKRTANSLLSVEQKWSATGQYTLSTGSPHTCCASCKSFAAKVSLLANFPGIIPGSKPMAGQVNTKHFRIWLLWRAHASRISLQRFGDSFWSISGRFIAKLMSPSPNLRYAPFFFLAMMPMMFSRVFWLL